MFRTPLTPSAVGSADRFCFEASHIPYFLRIGPPTANRCTSKPRIANHATPSSRSRPDSARCASVRVRVSAGVNVRVRVRVRGRGTTTATRTRTRTRTLRVRLGRRLVVRAVRAVRAHLGW